MYDSVLSITHHELKDGHWATRNWDQQFQTINTTTSQKKETKIFFIRNLGSYLQKLVN